MAKTKTAVASDGATPENTPLPGGGSWHWDDSLPGWAENLPAPDIALTGEVPQATTNPLPDITLE
jgi:hypothetical protein